MGNVADLVGGGTPSTQNPEYWDGDIDWYAPAEIANQIYVKTSQRKITEQGYDNSSAKLLPPGTVLFTYLFQRQIRLCTNSRIFLDKICYSLAFEICFYVFQAAAFKTNDS